ncbi:MAG TPA: VTT domain-containing protein, partial [Dehalococcoidia bacterium]
MSNAQLIHSIGYIGLFAIMFAETGLLVGFFLPGDTLLVSAGLLAARGQLNIVVLLAVLIAGAVLGDATGYWIGHQAGKRLFQRENSFWFRREHLEKAERFYERHGGKTIFIARFFSGLRTFAPIVAGAARMTYPRFALFNITGAISWITIVTMLGYIFGNAVTKFDHYIFFGALVLLPFPLLLAL